MSHSRTKPLLDIKVCPVCLYSHQHIGGQLCYCCIGWLVGVMYVTLYNVVRGGGHARTAGDEEMRMFVVWKWHSFWIIHESSFMCRSLRTVNCKRLCLHSISATLDGYNLWAPIPEIVICRESPYWFEFDYNGGKIIESTAHFDGRIYYYSGQKVCTGLEWKLRHWHVLTIINVHFWFYHQTNRIDQVTVTSVDPILGKVRLGRSFLCCFAFQS